MSSEYSIHKIEDHPDMSSDIHYPVIKGRKHSSRRQRKDGLGDDNGITEMRDKSGRVIIIAEAPKH